MWLNHLLSFIGTVAQTFFDAIGSTFLGRLVDAAFAISVAVALLHKTLRQGGWKAMLKHFQTDYRAGLKFAIWAAIIIYSPVVLWAVGKAAYQDHVYFLGVTRRQSLQIKSDANALQKAKDDCTASTGSLRERVANLEGTSRTLQSQNRDQQNSINHCQTQALRLLVPAPFEMKANVADLRIMGDAKAAFNTAIVVLSTNKPVSPVAVDLVCSHEFDVEGWRQTNKQVSGIRYGEPRKDRFSFPIREAAPAWTPDTYYVFLLRYARNEASDLTCHVQPA